MKVTKHRKISIWIQLLREKDTENFVLNHPKMLNIMGKTFTRIDTRFYIGNIMLKILLEQIIRTLLIYSQILILKKL